MHQQSESIRKLYDPSTDPRPKIDITKIIVPKNRMRKDFNGIQDLAESLKRHGILHPPTLSPSKEHEGMFDLVAGERRYRASLYNGWTEIPFNLRSDLDGLATKEIELEENLQRDNLSDLEKIEGIAQIHDIKKKLYGEQPEDVKARDGKKWTQDDTAEALGVSQAKVNQAVQVAKILRQRPDLKLEIQNLPLSAIPRALKQKLEVEDVQRRHSQGLLKTTEDLRHTDAVSGLRLLASDSVDCIVTDPPFGIPALADVEGATGGTGSFTALMKPDDNLNIDSVQSLMNEAIPEMYRVLKPNSHLYMFCCEDLIPFLKHSLKTAGFEVHAVTLIWYKGRATTVFNGYNYPSCYEPLLFAWKPGDEKRRLNGPLNAVLQFKPVPVAERFHIFQKPRDLLGALIKNSTKLGDLVCDPFAGSCATGMACKDTGRSFVAFEKNKEHWFAAQNILSAWAPLEVTETGSSGKKKG